MSHSDNTEKKLQKKITYLSSRIGILMNKKIMKILRVKTGYNWLSNWT